MPPAATSGGRSSWTSATAPAEALRARRGDPAPLRRRGRAGRVPLLRVTPGLDPLAPEAPVVFAFGPLLGTPLTTSAKFAVVAKSPLTGRINDALSS